MERSICSARALVNAHADGLAHGFERSQEMHSSETMEHFRAWVSSSLEALKTDPSNFARRAGLATTTLTRALHGDYRGKVRRQTILALAKVSPVPLSEPLLFEIARDAATLHSFMAPPMTTAAMSADGNSIITSSRFVPGRELTTTVHPGPALVGDRDLPVYASAEGGPDGAMIVTYDPIEWVKRPEPLMTVREGFAIYIVSDSMAPAYRPGDRALVHPLRQPLGGDDGLFIGAGIDHSFYALVKTLVASSDKAWRVQQYNPPSTFDLPKDKWGKAMKIVGKYGR